MGQSGTFHSSITTAAPSNLTAIQVACNDDVLPDARCRPPRAFEPLLCRRALHARLKVAPPPPPPARVFVCRGAQGDGEFHHMAATAPSVEDVVDRLNQFDWTDGVEIWQARARREYGLPHCTSALGDSCYPDLGSGASSTLMSTASYGYNWTHPGHSLQHGFAFHSSEMLGADPSGRQSAAQASYRTYPAGGYVTIIIPFLSDALLPEERGTHDVVTDFRLHRVMRSNNRTARFFCVRLSWNGGFIHQLCDPNDPDTGRTTGVVRAAIEEFWNDLKRCVWPQRDDWSPPRHRCACFCKVAPARWPRVLASVGRMPPPRAAPPLHPPSPSTRATHAPRCP